MIDPNLITTIRVGELPPDPLSLTSKIPHEVGTDLKYDTIQGLVDLLAPLVGKMQFEVVRMSVTTQYITDNFDGTGLGINLCVGFAICNGNNGTENLDGRVGIGYGASYSFVGINGGTATHTLLESEMPAHNHDINMVGYNLVTGNGDEYVVRSTGTQVAKVTDTKGGGQPHNNMQPYIVQLYMMKL